MTYDEDAFTAPPSILVIDDDPVLTKLLQGYLASTGNVTVSNSGTEGLAIARLDQPDLILLDVQMPGQDGFDIISELKTDPTVRHIPVIFITGEVLPEIESYCLEAGAADYIAKPVNPRVLQARTRTHLLIKHQADMLADLSFRDALTGALNRGAFDERLDSECARATWRARPIALLLIDVDHLDAYNDTYGHLAGDDVLEAVVGATRTIVARPGDVVGRFGGEEIAVLLPETTQEEALAFAEGIRNAVRALGIRHSGSTAADVVTVSIGVSGAAGPVTAESLIATTENSLGRAKSNGRDRVSG